jgi:uncharacterized membrane protein YbhN (UPF0104 family)
VGIAQKKPLWRQFGVWGFGVLALAAVVLVVTRVGELEHFVELMRRAASLWLLAALALQALTYLAAAGVWHVALSRAGAPRRLLTLFPLGLAKLFVDQAVPSGGLSGVLLVMRALTRREVPRPLTMAILLVALISYHAAYVIATLVAVVILGLFHAVGPAVLGIVGTFLVVAVGLPFGVLMLRRLRGGRLLALLERVPRLARLANDIADAPTHLLRDAPLIIATTALQLVIFVLDAATLYVMLRAIGQEPSPSGVFACFMIASVTALMGPIPLGLGVFEAASVAALHLVGIELEAALAATLLLRGFTFWLPMIPGLWLARRELRGA